MTATASIDPVWVGTAWVSEHTGLQPRQIVRLASHKPKALIPAHRREGMREWRFKTSEVKAWWAAAYNGASRPKEVA